MCGLAAQVDSFRFVFSFRTTLCTKYFLSLYRSRLLAPPPPHSVGCCCYYYYCRGTHPLNPPPPPARLLL